MVDGNTYTPFELGNISQKYTWLLFGSIFSYLDCKHTQKTHT